MHGHGQAESSGALPTRATQRAAGGHVCVLWSLAEARVHEARLADSLTRRDFRVERVHDDLSAVCALCKDAHDSAQDESEALGAPARVRVLLLVEPRRLVGLTRALEILAARVPRMHIWVFDPTQRQTLRQVSLDEARQLRVPGKPATSPVHAPVTSILTVAGTTSNGADTNGTHAGAGDKAQRDASAPVVVAPIVSAEASNPIAVLAPSTPGVLAGGMIPSTFVGPWVSATPQLWSSLERASLERASVEPGADAAPLAGGALSQTGDAANADAPSGVSSSPAASEAQRDGGAMMTPPPREQRERGLPPVAPPAGGPRGPIGRPPRLSMSSGLDAESAASGNAGQGSAPAGPMAPAASQGLGNTGPRGARPRTVAPLRLAGNQPPAPVAPLPSVPDADPLVSQRRGGGESNGPAAPATSKNSPLLSSDELAMLLGDEEQNDPGKGVRRRDQ